MTVKRAAVVVEKPSAPDAWVNRSFSTGSRSKRLKTSRDVRAVVFETMEFVRRLELSPCIHV